MSLYNHLINKVKDPNLKENFGITFTKKSIPINVETSIAIFARFKDMFEEFNQKQSDLDDFAHFGVKYFSELELKQGENALKKEIDFVINYFISNTKEEKDIQILKNIDKNKFIDFIKKVTKQEKFLIKLKDIKHIINIFLNPKSYIHHNKEKKTTVKIESKIFQEKTIKEKENQKSEEKKKEILPWSFLDFQSILPSFLTKNKSEKIESVEKKEEIKIKNDNSPSPPPTSIIPSQQLTSSKISERIDNFLNNSQLIISLNNYINELESKKISLKDINKISQKKRRN